MKVEGVYSIKSLSNMNKYIKRKSKRYQRYSNKNFKQYLEEAKEKYGSK